MGKPLGAGTWIAIGAAIVITAVAAVIAGIVLVTFGALRASEPYREAMRRAQSDPRVIAALGAPVEPQFLIGGNLNVQKDEGTADLNIPLEGPKTEARLRVIATKTRGRWYYQHIVLSPKNAADIDLLTSPGGSTSTAPRGD